MSLLKKLFGDPNEKYLKKLEPVVEQINSLEKDFEALKSEELKEKTAEFKGRLEKGEGLDDILPEAFALVREAAKRTLNQRHYDVQLLGGIVLHRGRIAEMKTGEGKTLVATLSVYLNALTGKGVHIVTVNDYLSRRDAVWMGQIYNALGLTAACINHESSFVYDPTHGHFAGKEGEEIEDKHDEERDTKGSFEVVPEYLRPCSRKEAYLADITYGTNNEFGFDYLRDNMAQTEDQMVQRPHHFAIVDEVDSILIDEARTPLIVSVSDEESGKMYAQFARIAAYLKEGADYNVDEKMKAVSATDDGISKVEDMLGVKNIYDPSLAGSGFRYVHHLEQALRAHALFKKDKEYVVKNGEVMIVDEFTGRMMPGRRFSGGLHQALEAKEGVFVQKESRTLASITFQNYFRLYEKLSGMTGTAMTSAEEFHKVYNLEVSVLPTNKPLTRKDLPDLVFKNEKGKFMAVAAEIKKRQEAGQPVLVGTVSIEKNEYLAALLKREGVPHEMLNAKNHEQEGMIIAQAGRLGSVTIATNMAGRGVDIALGGNPPDEAKAKKVKELGGLCVIGTERHEARRIDNQLRGRAGRQGDPGSTQFFVSLEDELMRIFGSDRIKSMMETLGIPDDQPIEAGLVSKAIESAQSKIEGHHFDSRKYVLEYDEILNRHRTAVYKLRKDIMRGVDLKDKITNIVKEEIDKICSVHTQDKYPDDWNKEEIFEDIKTIIPTGDELHRKLSDFKDAEEMKIYLFDLAENLYETKEKSVGPENMAQLEKLVSLRTVDMFWMDHLETMEHLRDSVRLRAYGQHDPLVEYKNESRRLFKDLFAAINYNIATSIFKANFIGTPRPAAPSGNIQLSSSKSKTDSTDKTNEKAKVGRNDPCPCGATKSDGRPVKFKRCHGS